MTIQIVNCELESIGEVIAAICKQGDEMFSLLNGHNKAEFILFRDGGFAR